MSLLWDRAELNVSRRSRRQSSFGLYTYLEALDANNLYRLLLDTVEKFWYISRRSTGFNFRIGIVIYLWRAVCFRIISWRSTQLWDLLRNILCLVKNFSVYLLIYLTVTHVSYFISLKINLPPWCVSFSTLKSIYILDIAISAFTLIHFRYFRKEKTRNSIL